MSDRMYRARWRAIQEEGTPHTFTGSETSDLGHAKAERNEVAALDYVEESWVETCQWSRVAFASRATSGEVES